MRRLTLKELVEQAGGQRAVARATGLSITSVNMYCNGRRPLRLGRARLAAHLRGLCPQADIAAALAAADAACVGREAAGPQPGAEEQTEQQGEDDMIVRKQILDPAARRQFKLLRDPFADPQEPGDLYLSPESRYVREYMYDAARNGGFIAVVGESGSGKSTLREDLIERLREDGDGVVVIEPYTLGMGGGRTGRSLRARDIAEAAISTLSPAAAIPASAEMRARRLHQLLRDSNRAGLRHVLIIEEAHDLHGHTLKALKRFWELKDGLKRLLGIILIGQTELLDKLGANQTDVREVVQRCVPVRLEPVKDPAAFLAHRFTRAGADLAAVFEDDALAALRDRLMVARDTAGRGVYMGYPLAISNLACAAINCAARLGEARVTADIVRQVRA